MKTQRIYGENQDKNLGKFNNFSLKNDQKMRNIGKFQGVAGIS